MPRSSSTSRSAKDDTLGASCPRTFVPRVLRQKNWDALIDCLSDLSWVQAAEVIIDHPKLPCLPTRDLRLYLESLIDAAERRTPDAVPKPRILFRIEDHGPVTAALNP